MSRSGSRRWCTAAWILSARCPHGLGKKALKRVSGDVAGGPVSLCRVRLEETRRGALCSVLTGGGTCVPPRYTPLTTACGGPPATASGPLPLLRPCDLRPGPTPAPRSRTHYRIPAPSSSLPSFCSRPRLALPPYLPWPGHNNFDDNDDVTSVSGIQ